MSKLIIWDIDGTLLHCYGSGRQAMEDTFFKNYGVTEALEGISLAGAVDLELVNRVFLSNQIENADIPTFFSDYAKQLAYRIKTGKGIDVLGGITEVLTQLQQPGIYHAVGTGNCRQGARVKLSLSGLDHFFETGAYGDQVTSRSALLALARENAQSAFKIKFHAEDIMVVGDTPQDIAAAKKNDFIAVATTTGYYGEGALTIHEPDYIIDHFSDLLGIIENQWPNGFWR